MNLIALPQRLGTFSRIIVFTGHVTAVYACALHLSPWLVGRWFAWAMPIMKISAHTIPADWYLQHLKLVTILPAFVVGCLAVYFFHPATATWTWIVPTAVLAYKAFVLHIPSSALLGNSMSAFQYYFDIKQVMPTRANFLTSDPGRVLAQMTFTAPARTT